MITKDIYWYISLYLPQHEIIKLFLNKQIKLMFDDQYYSYRSELLYNSHVNNYKEYICLLKSKIIDVTNPDFDNIIIKINMNSEILFYIKNEILFANTYIKEHRLTTKEIKNQYDKNNYFLYCSEDLKIIRDKKNNYFGKIIYYHKFNHGQLYPYLESNDFKKKYLSEKINDYSNLYYLNFSIYHNNKCNNNYISNICYKYLIVHLDDNPDIYYNEETKYNKIKNIKCIDGLEINCKQIIFYLSDIKLEKIDGKWTYKINIVIKKMIIKK